MLSLIELILAAWRLASMLVNENGPWAVFSRLRYKAGVRAVVIKDGQGNPTGTTAALTPLAELLTCVWCTSVWTAALLAIPLAPIRALRLVLAASAGAVLVHEAVERMRQ